MNNATRNTLNSIQDKLTDFKTRIGELKHNAQSIAADIADAVSQIETIRDEEQEKYDNMTEGFQNGDKGQVMQDAITEMESALSTLKEGEAYLLDLDVDEQQLDEAFSSIDNARA